MKAGPAGADAGTGAAGVPGGVAGSPARSGLNVGDPQAGMGLVPAVDGHQVGGQRLDLAAVAQAARVDAAHAGELADAIELVDRAVGIDAWSKL